MKTIALLTAVTLGFVAGSRLEQRRTEHIQRKLRLVTHELDRFENPYVFHHAERVARITGAPLYQVLTGKLDTQTKGDAQ
jgi:uncharacterized membrane-anchored protein YhcB (DUF1043 family)